MEELLLLGLGAVAVALSPFVPAVRPVAKVGVKGGLVIRDAAVAAAGLAASQVGRIRSPWSSDGEAESSLEVAAVTVDVAPVAANVPTKAAGKPATAKSAAAESAAEQSAAAESAAEQPAAGKAKAAKSGAGKSTAKKPAAKKRAPDAGERATAAVARAPAEATAAATTEAMTEAMTEATAAAMMGATTEAARVEAPIPTLVDVNGIGPKVAELLMAGGVTTLDELADADPEQLRAILRDAGSRYRAMNPDTWPGQARALLGGSPPRDLDGEGTA